MSNVVNIFGEERQKPEGRMMKMYQCCGCNSTKFNILEDDLVMCDNCKSIITSVSVVPSVHKETNV